MQSGSRQLTAPADLGLLYSRRNRSTPPDAACDSSDVSSDTAAPPVLAQTPLHQLGHFPCPQLWHHPTAHPDSLEVRELQMKWKKVQQIEVVSAQQRIEEVTLQQANLVGQHAVTHTSIGLRCFASFA